MKISRILIFIVVFSLCFCSLAFADDLEPDSSGSSSSAISDDDMDNAIRDLSNSLYQVQLLNDTRATTYTTTDIYNFMVNHFLMGGAQNGYMYQQYSTLLALNTKVQAIMTYANSIREYTELIHDSITGDNTPITLYDLIGDHLGNIANMLAITEGNTTLSAGELLLLINNTIDDSYLALGNIQTTLDSIQDNIALLYAVMTDIAESNNDIVTQTTNMNANMQLMIARLQTFNQDFNNINWNNLSSPVPVLYDNTDTIVSSSYISVTNPYILLDTISSFNNTFSVPTIVEINVPIRFTSSSHYVLTDIDVFYRQSNNYISAPDNLIELYYRNNPGSITIYLVIYRHNTYKILFNGQYYVHSTNITARYLNSDSIDYYYVYNNILNFSQHDILKKFEYLYASDDLIASKEEQQPVENQIIEDFTGNGSASVKIGDAVNVKQASNAIKSGLNTGANSGLALDYAFGYNNPSGLFVWFTQDTANWFTLYQPTRGVKNYSEVIWSDEIPDHITELDNKYIRGLSND